jgi:hypothetical protein
MSAPTDRLYMLLKRHLFQVLILPWVDPETLCSVTNTCKRVQQWTAAPRKRIRLKFRFTIVARQWLVRIHERKRKELTDAWTGLMGYGAQDRYLTTVPPQITYFKVKYRSHTNFARETLGGLDRRDRQGPHMLGGPPKSRRNHQRAQVHHKGFR